MSYWLDLNYIGAQPDLMQGAPSTGFGEAFTANLDATMKSFRSNAEESLLADQYFEQYDRAKQAGVTLPFENPVRDVGNPSRYAEYDLGVAMARETNPDLGLLTSAEISQRALDVARSSRLVARDLNSRTNVPGFLGEMAGGMAGSMTDPINITSMVLAAPLAMTGVGGFLANIGINMATEATTQTEQRDFLRRQGMSEKELDDQSLQSVLMAGAGTAALDLLLRGGGRAAVALSRRLRSGKPDEVAKAAGRVAEMDGAPQTVRDQARVVEQAAEVEATIPKRTRKPEQIAEHVEQQNGVLRSIMQGEADPVLSRNLEFVELPRTYTGEAELMRDTILKSPDMASIREEITAVLRSGQTETTPTGLQLELSLINEVPPVRGTQSDASRLNPEQIAPAVRTKDGSIHFSTEVGQPRQVADHLGFDPRIVDHTGYVVDGQFVIKKADAEKAQAQAAARERDRASATGPREVPVVREAVQTPDGPVVQQTIARPIGERIPDQERPPRPTVDEQVRNNTEIAEGKYLDSVMEELRGLVERNPAKVLDEESGLTVSDVLREIETDATAIKHIEACILGGKE